MKSGSHSHIGIFQVDYLNGRGFVVLFVVGSDVIERVTSAGRDGHGEW